MTQSETTLTIANLERWVTDLSYPSELLRVRKLDLARALLASQTALSNVEWIFGSNQLEDDHYWCPWCGNEREQGHKSDCERQAALLEQGESHENS